MTSFTFLTIRFSRAVWLVLVLMLSSWLPSQGQTNPPPPSTARPWSWATTVQHPTLNGYLRGGHTATDAAGNQYITGSFTGKVAFGNTTLQSRSSSLNDLFVAKLSPTGQWLWAVSPAATTAPMTDLRSSQGVDVAVDAQGNVTVLAGYYGPLTLGTSVLPEPLYRAQSLVVARLSPQGQWLNMSVASTNTPGALQWGSYTLEGTALSVDTQGNACVSGFGVGQLSFGAYAIAGPNAGQPQAFVASIGPSGAWRWATPLGDYQTERVDVRQMAVGPQGDFWVAGHFVTRTATFGSFVAQNASNSSSDYDVFLAHLSAQGQWLGVHSAGGVSSDYVSGVTVDSQNNVYLSGGFRQRAVFGSLRIVTPVTPNTNHSPDNAFLAKLGAAGQWEWVRQGGGVGADQGQGVAVDAQGDVYWSGSCSDTTVLGPTTLLGSTTFFAKLSPTGQWQWAVGAPRHSYAAETYLAPDPANGVRVAAVYMGNMLLGTHALPSPADANVMGAHLSASGQWAWEQASASGGTATIRQVIADAQGNTYATGSFGGTVVVGGTTLMSRGYTDAFVISYDRQGGTRWITQLGTSAADEGQLIALDPRGGAVLTGVAGDTITLGSDRVATSSGGTYSTYGNIGFLARLTPQGQVLGGVSAPQIIARLTVAANGDAVLAGTFENAIRFGSRPPLVAVQTDGFVARISPANQWLWAQQLRGSLNYSTDGLSDLVLDSAGNGYLTGYYEDTIRLGALTLSSVDGPASYLASFDNAGQWRWARHTNDSPIISGYLTTTGLALSPSGGQLLVSGTLSDTVSLGPVRLSPFSGTATTFVGAMALGGQWLGANIPTGSGYTFGGALATGGTTSSYMLGGVYGKAQFGSDSVAGVFRQLSGGPRPSTGSGAVHQRAGGVSRDVPGPPIPPPPTPFVTAFTGAGQWQWAQVMHGATTLTANSADDLFVAGGMATGDTTFTIGAVSLTAQTLPIGYLTAMIGGPLGVHTAAAQPRLAMWPNPAHHTLHITAPPKGAQSVRVLDGVGRVVFTQTVTGAPTALTLTLPTLTPGLYLVQCGGLTNRLVVE